MSTFDELVTTVSRTLRDPDGKTFTSTEIGDMVKSGLVEVGRIAPERFQQDIIPVAGQLEYALMRGDPEIEVVKVEVWHIATDDYGVRFMAKFRAGAKEYTNSSDVGWRIWNGTLYLSNPQEYFIDPDVHYLRVWGYSPYEQVSGGTPMPCSYELEKAIESYCRVEAFRRLTMDRDLFTQWQTIPNNSDVTAGGLMSALTVAEDDWRRRKRDIYLIREGN